MQAPGNTQSFNRYSYVFDGPLSYVTGATRTWHETLQAGAALDFQPRQLRDRGRHRREPLVQFFREHAVDQSLEAAQRLG